MSRESELYRDKIEVSLDGRQIFYLFFGGAVIVGLVFVLGVMVGRRVEARGHIERAHTPATVDPLAALDRLEGNGGLSFQGALRGGEPPASDVEKTIGAIAKARQPAAAKLPELTKLEPIAKIEANKLDDKKPDADHKSDNKKIDKSEPKPEPQKKLEATDKKLGLSKKLESQDTKKAGADKPVIDKKPESENKAGADKPAAEKKPEIDKKAETEKKPEAEKKAEPEKKPKFTLQLSSFQDKAEAQAFLDSVKTSGFQAYLTEGEVDGKQYYRVRLGTYRSFDAANDAKIEFEKSAKKSALVTRL